MSTDKEETMSKKAKQKKKEELKRARERARARAKEKEDLRKQFQECHFLNGEQVRKIANILSSQPDDYSEKANSPEDDWNYYQMDVDFNGIKLVSIGISNLKVLDAIRRHNVPTKEIAIGNFLQADSNGTSFYDINPNEVFYKKESDTKSRTVGPIIILQECNGGNRVIDGNHRVSEAILNSKESISAHIISDNFLLENDCFQLDYDKRLFEAHYLFNSSFISFIKKTSI